MVRLVLTLLLSALLAALGAWIRAPLPFWLTGALIIALWWSVYPHRVAALARASTERSYREGKNRGLLGPHRVTVDAEWLTEATDEREHRTRWRAMEKVERAGEYVFLYVSGFSAVVVPERAFASEAEAEDFVRTCEGLLASNAGERGA